MCIRDRVNPDYDYNFASEMMERFELDGKKKFNHLSLGKMCIRDRNRL